MAVAGMVTHTVQQQSPSLFVGSLYCYHRRGVYFVVGSARRWSWSEDYGKSQQVHRVVKQCKLPCTKRTQTDFNTKDIRRGTLSIPQYSWAIFYKPATKRARHRCMLLLIGLDHLSALTSLGQQHNVRKPLRYTMTHHCRTPDFGPEKGLGVATECFGPQRNALDIAACCC